MEEHECLICNCELTQDYQHNIMVGQSCNCIYKVHDECIIKWCNVKTKCLICHKPIKLYEINKHRQFKNENISPRMSFFYRFFNCCC